MKLRAAGYDFACYETDYIPGLKLECICDKNGREIEGDFILNIDSMGREHGLLEAGFGFGIREHRRDDVQQMMLLIWLRAHSGTNRELGSGHNNAPPAAT